MSRNVPSSTMIRAGRVAVIGTVFTLVSFSACVNAAEVITIAGTGQSGTVLEPSLAAETAIGEPYGLVIGPDGALYVCEIAAHLIRRIDLDSGRMTVVVGIGEAGNSGDGGPATSAKMTEPYEVRFDSQGNMIFVDMPSAVVRRVAADSGVITTIAGTGTAGFNGEAGLATEVQLDQPHSIALDDRDNIYICDIKNHRVRRVDALTGELRTVVGGGEKPLKGDSLTLDGLSLRGPRALDYGGQHGFALAFREGNSLYWMDVEARALRHLAGTGEKGYTGDGGDALQARLSGPKGVAISPAGDIYFADTESHTIRVYRRDRKIIETVVGDGERGDGPDGDSLRCRLNRPHGVCVDAEGNVYIGDSENHRVRMLRVD